MKISDYNLYNNYWNTMTTAKKTKKENTKQSQFSYGRSSSKKKHESGIVIKKDISASSYLLRIASAGSAPRVSGVIRSARAEMRFVKSSGAGEEQIAKAIRILKKVIAKGNIKVGRLKTEKQLKLQKEMAEKLKNGRKEEELYRKLRTKKRSRRAKEMIDAADMESATIESSSYKEDYREEIAAIYQSFSETESSIDVSISDASSIPEGIDTEGVTEVDISV